MSKEYIEDVPVAEVIVGPDRFRTDMGDIEGLAASIASVGLMNPIILNNDLRLIAGERRLRAHKHLGLTHVKSIIRNHSEIQHRILEITENIDRKQFTWDEEALATEEMHRMLAAERGEDWTQQKTAKESGLSVGKISTDLNIARAIQDNPDIFEGVKDRKTALARLKNFEIGEARAELALRKSRSAEGQKAQQMIFQGNCIHLIDETPDASIDAIISDPFYGLDISAVKKTSDKGGQDIYVDNIELYKSTMSTIIPKFSQKVKPNAWILIFGAIENFQFLYNELTSAGWNCDHMPGLWYRGNVGQTNDPNHRFARCYEMFIYGYKGDAVLSGPGKPLILQHPGVNPSDKLHEVQKPLSLMEDCIDRLCLPGSVILDFMCGSGTTIVAAIKRGCRAYGFELSEYNYGQAISRVTSALQAKNAGKHELIK